MNWLPFPGLKCPIVRAFYPVMKRGLSSPTLLLWDPNRKNDHWKNQVLYWMDVPILRPGALEADDDVSRDTMTRGHTRGNGNT